MPDAPSGRVQARTVKGFRDILPHQIVARRRMIDRLRAVFESHGFVPFDTPALEYVDALLGLGEEGTKSLFRMKSPEGEDVALRYDLTVPLARVVSQYPNLPRPFRRYQVSPVWRADKPDPGRFREFTQFDIDSVGSPTVLADAEILMAMDEAFTALGLTAYRIRYSSRKILNSLLKYAGIEGEAGLRTLRTLDKLDKQGLKAVLLELGPGRMDASGDRIQGLGLASSSIERVERFVSLEGAAGGGRTGLLDAVESLFVAVDGAGEGIAELREIDRYLAAEGIPDDRVAVDLSIARGLDYYTGPVFEAILTDLPEFGAVFGGGRYDGLVERFLGTKVEATGASIGVDRLLAALDRLGLVPQGWATARVLTTVMDQGRIPDYLRMTRELRDAGIPAEIYMGGPAGMKKQFAYADKVGIPVVLIAGSNEFEAGTVSIKDLREGKQREGDAADREAWVKQRFGQRTVPRAEMIATIRSLLEAP
ncbi:MAG TPA: histidine--tRNA ligase [Verrucomicrobiae bacterium]|nr:histidine--tRNA ligase [Verrucomicrobiae bacterium]